MSETIPKNIQSILKDGIQEAEVQKLRDLAKTVRDLPAEDQAKCIEKPIMDEIIIAINTHEGESKLALVMLKGELDKCSAPKGDIETSLSNKGYTELKGEFASNVMTPKMMAYFEKVFDSKLSEYKGVFSPNELSSMQLIMWGENVNFSDSVGSFALQGVQSFFTGGANTEKNGQEKIDGFFKGISKFLEDCSQIKKSNPEIDLSNAAILKLIDAGETDPSKLLDATEKHNDVYTEIRNKTKEMGDTVGDLPLTVEGLMEKAFGSGLGEKFSSYLKDNPWISIILSMFGLGGLVEKYLDSDGQKRANSLKQLGELSEDSHSPIRGMIPEGFLKKLDTKDLDSFFVYLETEEIDYSKKDFWTQFISGKSSDVKISKIHTLLKGKNSSLFSKDDFKDEGKGFTKKLNNIQNLSQQVVQKETQEKKAAAIAALPPITTTTTTKTPSPQGIPNSNGTDTTNPVTIPDQATSPLVQNEEPPKGQDQKPQTETPEITPELRAKFVAYRDLEIKDTLLNASSLPIEISYERKDNLEKLGIAMPKTIALEGSELLIDGKRFPIKIKSITHTSATIGDVDIKNISLGSNGLVISLSAKYTAMGGLMSGEKKQDYTLTKNELVDIFFSLMEDGKVNKNISPTGDITGGSYTIGT